MNKEIKFRAWFKPLKRMYAVRELKFNRNKTIVIMTNHTGGTAPNNYELMQFTGLKDKNGKKIYEGDIVSGIMPGTECDEPFEKMIIKYEEGGFGIYRPDEYFNAKSGLYFGSLISCTLNKCIEVIGNIYENPELLKVDTDRVELE